MMYFRTIAALCFFLVNGLADGKSESSLRYFLFEQMNYQKSVRPAKESSDVVNVEVLFEPIRLREVEDELHVLTLDAWLTISWREVFLQWDPAKYGNLEKLVVPADDIWLPDLTFYSGVPETSTLPKHTNVVIKSDGTVFWVPSISVENRCSSISKTNLRADCTISVLSWAYDVTQLDIKAENRTSMEYFERDFPGWDMEFVGVERILKDFKCCPNPWAVANFRVTLKRKLV